MSRVSRVVNASMDYWRGGFGFWLGGMRSRWSAAPRIPVRLPDGATMTIRGKDSDFTVLREVFRDKDYQPRPAVMQRAERRYREILDSGGTPVIVDAGANIGAASLWFARTFPDAAIVAIEPDTNNATLARANLAPYPNVRLVEAAIGSEAGFVRLEHEAANSSAVQTRRDTAGCPVITVDDAQAHVPRGELFAVKIDIEGFESDLFERNTDWLERAFLVYVEPHDWLFPGRGTSRPFQRAFADHDFELFIHGANLIYARR